MQSRLYTHPEVAVGLSLPVQTRREATAVRRRYFVTDTQIPGSAERVAADFRKAGITAWTNLEYGRAFASVVKVSASYLFLGFSVMCIERDGERTVIDRIASSCDSHVYELDAKGAKAENAYIDAMSRLAQVRGLWLKSNYSTTPIAYMKREPLSQLLGIASLDGFRGWIEQRTASDVLVRFFLPAAAQQRSSLTAVFPINSCPALRVEESTSDAAERISIEDLQLRPYQTEQKERILQAWRTMRSVMLQMPTGTGKTRLFVSLIRDIQKLQPEARMLIVAHRTELIEQISQSLTNHYELRHSILGGKDAQGDTPILVASIQGWARRVGKDEHLTDIDYIIIDEAHHSLAPSYKKVLETYSEAKVLGVTATPYRLKKASFDTLYDTLIESAPMRQFLADGYLANYRFYTVSDRTVALSKVNRLTHFGADGDYKSQDLCNILDNDSETERLYDCYAQYATGRKGIIYAVSREHAAHIADLYNKKGVAAAAIDCNTPREERQRLINDFKQADGRLQVLVNVELFTEGFDCPAIDFVLLARPTRSLTLYLQQVGRALRPPPSGDEVLILDYAGLYNRFGFPERPRNWQAHFNGSSAPRENYPLRHLGSSSVCGLMKEVEKQTMKTQMLQSQPTVPAFP